MSSDVFLTMNRQLLTHDLNLDRFVTQQFYHDIQCHAIGNNLMMYFLDRCDMPLGVEEKEVADQLMTASSYSGSSCRARFGRLNSYAGAGAWCAKRNDRNQWLQVDFGAMAKITRVATQGRRGSAQWVKTYYVTYSKKGYSFAHYREKGRTKVWTFAMILPCHAMS